ncbi:MAG: hypothetical protein WCT14_10065 [Treponemataceae bacterium]
MVKIGIIVSQLAYERVRQSVPVLGDEYKIVYFTYKDIHEAEEICFRNIDQVDAYLFGGWFVFRMIKDKSLFKKRPCFSFPRTTKEELYALLLKFFMENKGFDLSRTYIDCLDETNNYLDLKEIIPAERFPYTYSFPYDEDLFVKIFDTHMKLWKEGKIDISITRSGSVERMLRNEGIQAYYLFPSKESILNVFQTVINHFKIMELENSQVATGHISIHQVPAPTSIDFDDAGELKLIELHQAIMSFAKENSIPNTVQKYINRYEVYLSKGTLKEVTGNYSHCSLLEYLRSKLKFKIDIGWGLGADVRTARQNAQYANIEAERHGGDCTFVVSEQNDVIGPLQGNNRMVYKNTDDPLVADIGKKTKLSPLTIHKLIGIVEKRHTKKLSAYDVAYYLGITERSANRILNKLESNGNAVLLYTKSEKLRGRPKKVYSIELPTSAPF